MTLLAIDTAAQLCAACLHDGRTGEELGRAVLDIGKGHAEHLIPVVRQALASGGRDFSDLNALAVAVGPGSFTGIRVGVSAARGFALALALPVTGVTTLEALAAEARGRVGPQAVLAALDAGRDEIHAALYGAGGETLAPPAVLSLEEAAVLARGAGAALAGTAADMIAQALGETAEIAGRAATADIGVYARLAAAKPASADRPAPLYLRRPDAKPQAGFSLPRKQA